MVSLLTHICITRPQWVNWTNTDLLSTETLTVNFTAISIKIQWLSLRKQILKMSSAKCQPLHSGINVLSPKCVKSLGGVKLTMDYRLPLNIKMLPWLAKRLRIRILILLPTSHINSWWSVTMYSYITLIMSELISVWIKLEQLWGYPPPPHDYPYHWVILDPKSKEDKVKVTNLKNSPKFCITRDTPS